MEPLAVCRGRHVAKTLNWVVPGCFPRKGQGIVFLGLEDKVLLILGTSSLLFGALGGA